MFEWDEGCQKSRFFREKSFVIVSNLKVEQSPFLDFFRDSFIN